MKANAKKLIHKTVIGSDELDIRNINEVIEAYHRIRKRIEQISPRTFQEIKIQMMFKSEKKF